jgi:hypothetical protein
VVSEREVLVYNPVLLIERLPKAQEENILECVLSFLSFRGWFTSGSSTALPGPNPSMMDPGSGDKDRNLSDKWSLFGPRPLQKSDSGKPGHSQKKTVADTLTVLYTRCCLLQSFAVWFTSAGGFTIQAYKGAQKPTPMELIRAQATRMAEDPATFKPPKIDVPVIEGKKQPPRAHNLKPRDLNVLTPTGF